MWVSFGLLRRLVETGHFWNRKEVYCVATIGKLCSGVTSLEEVKGLFMLDRGAKVISNLKI